jgi:hypothetical protein
VTALSHRFLGASGRPALRLPRGIGCFFNKPALSFLSNTWRPALHMAEQLNIFSAAARTGPATSVETGLSEGREVLRAPSGSAIVERPDLGERRPC